MAECGKVLVTIRPGPVLHVWCDGTEVARVPLTIPQAVALVQDVLAAIRWPQ